MARQRSLCRTAIRLQQAAEELFALHPPDHADAADGLGLTCSHVAWNAIADALMRAFLVENTLLCVNDAAQALDAEQDRVPQALLPGAQYIPFRVGVRVRCVVGRADGLHTGVREHRVETTREALVAVVEQEAWLDIPLLTLPQHVTHLLLQPPAVWREGDLGQQDRACS